MADNVSRLDEISRKGRELAVAIEESVAGFAAQAPPSTNATAASPGTDVASGEATGGGGSAGG